MKKIFFIALILSRFNSFGQIYPQSDFVQTPIPGDRSKEWYDYNRSGAPFVNVSLIDGELQLSKGGNKNVYVSYNLPHGELGALDMGEWGGGLYYKPDSNLTETIFDVNGKFVVANREISKDIALISPRSTSPKGNFLLVHGGNVNNIFAYKGELYFTEGLAHMGENHGALYKLEHHDNVFNVVKMLDFVDAIRAVAVYRGRIYISTFKRFYVVKDFQKELILDNLFWYGFNPRSIAVKDEQHIYIGMSGFYAQIDAIKKEISLYRHK